jgi:hypothetical protein
MNFKRERFWLAGIVLMSFLLVCILTEFSLTPIDIQLHDTHVVIDWVSALGILIFVLFLIRISFTGVIVLTKQSPVLRAISLIILSLILAMPVLLLIISIVAVFNRKY